MTLLKINNLTKRIFSLSSFFLLILVSSNTYADNGKIAYAYPVENIKIDGDLSDWSDDLMKFPISVTSDSKPINEKDFKAYFRAGYNLKNQSLYLAVEIFDDSQVVAEKGNDNLDSQDGFSLYIDRKHLRRGSGSVLYSATLNSRDVSFARNNWDPINANANWDNVELKISRKGSKTVCEWRIFLGKDIYPNKTIGLDHFLVDRDKGEKDATYFLWGEGFAKSIFTGRLGDVILVESNATLGEVQGKVKWKENINEPIPAKVRLTSVENPDLWVLANTDKEGNYSAKLPVGNYFVDTPFTLSKPFVIDARAKPLRIDGRIKVRATVKENQISKADDLELDVFYPPEYLIREKGIIHDYDSSKEVLVDSFIEAYRQYYQIPGVSVALVKDGKLVYHKNFGVKNNLSQEKVTDSTLFEAASITKPVFAFAVMRLAEKGLIDLDKPLYKYLPFENIAEDERSKLLTARIILSHKSGLPNWAFGGPGGWRNGGKTKLNFKPGERFGYSGEGYNYLGRVLEKITGKKLNRILKEEVTEPLGMKQTYFSDNEKLAKNAAIGHNHYLPMFWGIIDFPSPASSMHTEAKDFSNFMVGLLNQKGLKKTTYAEMFKTHTAIPPDQRVYDNGWTQSMSLGFFIEETPYGKLIQHGGNNGDFHCKFGIIPEKKIGYAIYTNSNAGDKLNRAFEIFLLYGNKVKN